MGAAEAGGQKLPGGHAAGMAAPTGQKLPPGHVTPEGEPLPSQ
jgi:hypothetical protein